MKVKVSKRNQIAVPAEARKALGIVAGDTLLVELREGILYMTPEPSDYARSLLGLHKEVWEGVDPVEYLRREREDWRD
jgi:AbrB family looped-hinge helix DNA binding protein